MSRKSTRASVLVSSLVACSLGLTLGSAGCCPDGTLPPCDETPVPGGPTVVVLVDEVFNDTPINRNFNPSAAGKLITVRVSGDVTGSRLPVAVTDVGTGNNVAAELLPTTNSTTVTFTSTSNGIHWLNVPTNNGTGSNSYTVYITEQ